MSAAFSASLILAADHESKIKCICRCILFCVYIHIHQCGIGSSMYGKWASSSPIISDSLSPAGSTSSKRKQFGSVWHTGLFTAPKIILTPSNKVPSQLQSCRRCLESRLQSWEIDLVIQKHTNYRNTHIEAVRLLNPISWPLSLEGESAKSSNNPNKKGLLYHGKASVQDGDIKASIKIGDGDDGGPCFVGALKGDFTVVGEASSKARPEHVGQVEGSPKSWAFGESSPSWCVRSCTSRTRTPHSSGSWNKKHSNCHAVNYGRHLVRHGDSILWCSQVLPGICHRVWKLWAPWYHGRCVLTPMLRRHGHGDMVGFPPEAKLLSEEGIGAWSLDGRWWVQPITRRKRNQGNF